MKITKCDRCGCEIPLKKCNSTNIFDAVSEILNSLKPESIKYSITKHIDGMTFDVDLCEDCTNKFKAWMNPERIETEVKND